LDVLDRGRRLPARLSLGPGFSAQEARKGRSTYYYSSQAVWNVVGVGVDRTKPNKLDTIGSVSGNLHWAGLEDQFFAALLLPRESPSQLSWRVENLTAIATTEDEANGDVPEPAPLPILAMTLDEDGGQLFVGPKQYRMLRGLGGELDKVVWFSSQAWLAWIVKMLYLALLWLHDNVAHNYGVAIVLATVALRIVLFPVNQYAMVNMKKQQLQMQKLQPKIKAIRNKYKKVKDATSRSKMNQETMEMYRREGVNPAGGLAGCLPLLAQFPILIGFYNMLTVSIELRGAPFFFWIQDLSLKDPTYITPLLMGATMFVQQKMAMSKIKDPQQLQQQRMMLFMPVMFTFICLNMPSGLVLYWFVNNLMAMGQQWLVNKHTSRLEQPEEVAPKAESKGDRHGEGVRGKRSRRGQAGGR
jgi:YidC/Oxa1 family membrane protein insertase